MESPQKLKRGLKDISPLFGKLEPLPAEEKPSPSLGKTQCLSVYSANLPGDSLLLSTFLASKISQPLMPCFLLTVQTFQNEAKPLSRQGFSLPQEESYGEHLKRLGLFWDEFEQKSRRGGGVQASIPDGRRRSTESLFLDFDHTNLRLLRGVVPLLDKCVLMIQPTLESMTECYRMVKSFLCLNPDLEFYMLFEGSSSDPRGEILFEKFSSILSKRLGASISWLGNLDWFRTDQPLHFCLNFPLLFPDPSSPPSLEKRNLGEFLRKRFGLFN